MLRTLSCWKIPCSQSTLRKTAILSAAMLIAAGCKVGPDYFAPPAPVLQHDWSEKIFEVRENGGEVDETNLHNMLPALDDWWTVFNDDTMNMLLQTVNEQNLDIRIAAQRIYQAEMDYRIYRGELFPAIGTSASFTRTMLPSGVPQPKHTYASTWTWDAAASWEVDVFGQIQRYCESYAAAWQATQEDLNNTKILLLAETARTYINARQFQEQERIANADIQDLETYLEKIRARHDAGADCNVELVQAQANLATVKATLPAIQSSFCACTTRLASLMGCTPELVEDILLRDEGYIPNAPDALAVGIPADLLRRRPDIRALERRLAQQTALIGVAEAELYPKFYVDGVFGLESAKFEDLFSTRNMVARISPSLQWRIFEFGRVRCAIAKQQSVTEAMSLEYRQTVLEAAEEVNNALTDYVKLQQQYEEQVESVRNYEEALKLSLALYEAGKREYMVVLDSQRHVLSNRQDLAKVHAQLASSVVTLYTALGGGWQVPPMASQSISLQTLRMDTVPPEMLHMSLPGEGVNALGPAAMRGLPEEVLSSSKLTGGKQYTLPPEGQTQTTKKQKHQIRAAEMKKEIPSPMDDVPELPSVDETGSDFSEFPIPMKEKSILHEKQRAKVTKPSAKSVAQAVVEDVDPLKAGLLEDVE